MEEITESSKVLIPCSEVDCLIAELKHHSTVLTWWREEDEKRQVDELFNYFDRIERNIFPMHHEARCLQMLQEILADIPEYYTPESSEQQRRANALIRLLHDIWTLAVRPLDGKKIKEIITTCRTKNLLMLTLHDISESTKDVNGIDSEEWAHRLTTIHQLVKRAQMHAHEFILPSTDMEERNNTLYTLIDTIKNECPMPTGPERWDQAEALVRRAVEISEGCRVVFRFDGKECYTPLERVETIV